MNEFNEQYEQKHLAFETQFWGTKMALSDTDDIKFNAENLSQTKKEMYVQYIFKNVGDAYFSGDGRYCTLSSQHISRNDVYLSSPSLIT